MPTIDDHDRDIAIMAMHVYRRHASRTVTRLRRQLELVTELEELHADDPRYVRSLAELERLERASAYC